MANTVDIKALLAAGAHFGHKTSRWHPKMAPYIHSKRGENHIINLEITVDQLETALKFVEETVARGHQILLVGTKRQAKDIILKTAQETGQPYVTERWLGGMLTNSNTINTRVKRLKELEAKMASGELAAKYNKLEVQRYQEQIDAMNVNFGGIKEMQGKLGAIFIVDIAEEETAVREAIRLNVPIVAMVDTNVDPTQIKYPIASNDDAIKAVALICEYLKLAILEGQNQKTKKEEVPEKTKKEEKSG
ncbi:MAG: 30S ribosomal protein S2 [Candidatus Saccharibacteria bacterium]